MKEIKLSARERYDRRLMSKEEMAEYAGWWKGSLQEWDSLPIKEREEIAFNATGCEVAYPTWEKPVDCCHAECRIRRGEMPKIAATNIVLRHEINNGWLRFRATSKAGRHELAKLVKAVRNKAIATGIYDPWEMPGGWMALVYTGVQS